LVFPLCAGKKKGGRASIQCFEFHWVIFSGFPCPHPDPRGFCQSFSPGPFRVFFSTNVCSSPAFTQKGQKKPWVFVSSLFLTPWVFRWGRGGGPTHKMGLSPLVFVVSKNTRFFFFFLFASLCPWFEANSPQAGYP